MISLRSSVAWRSAGIPVLLLAASLLHAQSVKLNSFPTIAVADSRSTVTITAEIRDRNGRAVPDGTQVIFTSTLGNFSDTVVTTSSGVARAILTTGSAAATAVITVSVPSINATNTVEVEMVSDRNLLSSAQDYIELVSGGSMLYSAEMNVIQASKGKEQVEARYRDIQIIADDVQVNVPTYEVKAKNAILKIGKFQKEFKELYFKMNARKGVGLATYTGKRIARIVPLGLYLKFEEEDVERFGLVEVRSSGVYPLQSPNAGVQMDFADLSEVANYVSAKKAVIIPTREVQFQDATLTIGNAKVLKLPLYKATMGLTPTSFTQQIVNMNDNQLEVNYPHYLTLKPGETSLLRFRTGQNYGRGVAPSRGMFLDYELNWSHGNEMNGGLTINSLLRDDWGLNAKHFMKIDKSTSMTALLDAPSHQNIYGSANLTRDFDGFRMAFDAMRNQSLRGLEFQSDMYRMTLEKDPMKFGKAPLRMYFGVTANYNTLTREGKRLNGLTGLLESFQQTNNESNFGLRMRTQTLPITFDANTSLNGSFSVSQLLGSNTESHYAVNADATLNKRFRYGNMLFSYNYGDDGLTKSILGRDRVSLQTSMQLGKSTSSFFMSKSLHADQVSMFADYSYRFSNTWGFSATYTMDQFFNDKYVDYGAMLSYRLGFRDIGLIWSKRTNRIGVQIFGSSF